MRFLADENVEKSIVSFLRKGGHDVAYIPEVLSGCSDDEVLKIANEENRILLTNDADFGEMVFRQNKICVGVILMRFASAKVEYKLKVLKHLLKYHSKKLLGHFIVINSQQIRIRPCSD